MNKNLVKEEKSESHPLNIWFQESVEGLILFLVFHTQSCRWGKCTSCSLPNSENYIPFDKVMPQVDNILEDIKVIKKRKQIKKVIVSNNGSILDQDTFPTTALLYLVAEFNKNFPNLEVLSLETRPEYVEFSELELISRALKEHDARLEIAVGFEAFDDKIRNDIFSKGLSLEKFENLVEKAAKYDCHLKCYFMQKPVAGISDEEAVVDVKKAIDYLDSMAHKYDCDINMHLNPTYVAEGTILEEQFKKGQYTPPLLIDVAKAISHGENKYLTIFVGLDDEDLAVENGSFIRPGDENIIDKLDTFNKNQEFSILLN